MLGQQAKETSSILLYLEMTLLCKWSRNLTANHFFYVKISNIPVNYANNWPERQHNILWAGYFRLIPAWEMILRDQAKDVALNNEKINEVLSYTAV